jgi:hypothetical protein
MFLHLTLAATLASLPTPTTSEISILSVVPENSFALVHCTDFASLRSRAERNDWYRLLGSKNGAPLLEEMAHEFNTQTSTDLDELLQLGKELHGESVFFLTRNVAGFVTEAPADRRALAEAMRIWLPDPGPDTVSRITTLGDARVEMVAWPESRSLDWNGRQGHFAAFVDHPNVLGLFSGNDAESLIATLEASLAGFGSDRKAPVVAGFESARASAPRCFGVEAFVNFSPFVVEAEKEMARAMEGTFPDPTGMLGVDEGLWLHATSDIFPGTRIDCSARLNIPKDTLAASLADTFQSLPADLPAQLPTGIWSLYAWRWDMNLFYQRVRTAFEERHGEDCLQALDQGVNMAKAMSGVDPITEVLEQLDGTFAVFFAEDEGVEQGLDDFNNIGFLASLIDGDAFLDSFEKLVGGGPLETELDLVEIEDVDVYVFGEDEIDGGLAFLPRTLIASPGREILTRSLRAVNGVEGANMLDGSDFQGEFDANLGCCFFSCQDLAALEEEALSRMNGRFVLPPAEGEEIGRSPFDSILVDTVRRTPDGFRFELHTK